MILVCGGTGMLGSRVAARLRQHDHPVRALVRPASDASQLEAIGAEVVGGDVRDRDSLRQGPNAASVYRRG
ncbi:MAG: SDR family oxidoreductase [Candidatus Limnocylindria bacterium]